MAAYVIADVTVTNPAGMEAYVKVAGPTIGQYGGRALAVSEQAELVEGSWQPKRLVVLEFDSLEQAKRWYDSQEYTDAKRMRQQAGTTNLVLVPGL
jgi:uncharacterized protein (DUF1330 family)